MPPDLLGQELKQELRYGTESFLKNRRAIVGLSVFSTMALGGVALFQVGLLRKLPDPPLPFFDADAVNASPGAYSLLQTPDALLGMASYAVTGCLAGMGRLDRSVTVRWIPLAMGVKTLCDAALAGRMSMKQWTKLRRFSVWSLLVSGATFAALALAVPESKAALQVHKKHESR
jgi:hypothetical protein